MSDSPSLSALAPGDLRGGRHVPRKFLVVVDNTPECVMNLIQSDKNISILVLATATSKEGPAPLVSLVAGPQAGTYPIPVTIVPGKLSDEEIDALA